MTDTKTTTITVIPAEPGFRVAIYFPAGTDGAGTFYEPEFRFAPIVAWAVEAKVGQPDHDGDVECRAMAHPITPEPACRTDEVRAWFVVYPDGRFVNPWDAAYDNEQEALAELARYSRLRGSTAVEAERDGSRRDQ
jgi:hypothetical protein